MLLPFDEDDEASCCCIIPCLFNILIPLRSELRLESLRDVCVQWARYDGRMRVSALK